MAYLEKRPRFSEAERRKVKAGIKNGKTWKEIGESVGRDPAAVRKFARMNRLYEPDPENKILMNIVQDNRGMFGFVEPPRKYYDDPVGRMTEILSGRKFENVRLHRPPVRRVYKGTCHD